MRPALLPGLRRGRTWFGVGLGLLLVVAVVCLMPVESVPQTGMSDKTEHFLAFGALGLWFGGIVMRRALVWVALGLLAFGGAIEFLQGAMGLGRYADVRDFVADAIGVAIGVALALTPLGRWAAWVEQRLPRAYS